MTWGLKNLVGLVTLTPRKGFFGTTQPIFGRDWSEIEVFRGLALNRTRSTWTLDDVYTYAIGCHVNHFTEFCVALLAYYLHFLSFDWQTECKVLALSWCLPVVGFHLACELFFCGGWHLLLYGSNPIAGRVREKLWHTTKFNDADQYGENSPHLRREVTFTTLGWLQSAFWQILVTHLWARGSPFGHDASYYTDFFGGHQGDNSSPPQDSEQLLQAIAHTCYSLLTLSAVTYWREIHFYFAHRGIHPWWDRSYGLAQGDVGAFLYRHAHSLHHKSFNPGPWSGLSMHPIEHFLYYSCAWGPCVLAPVLGAYLLPAGMRFQIHPLVFLYCKYHADIAPIGGHDGFGEPGGNADFHYLHHSMFECNYGVSFPVCFDTFFGTFVDWSEVREKRSRSGKLHLNGGAKKES